MNLQLALSDTTHGHEPSTRLIWYYSITHLNFSLFALWCLYYRHGPMDEVADKKGTFSSPYLILLITHEPSARLIWYYSLHMSLQLTLPDTPHYTWTFSSPYLILLITHDPSAHLIWYHSLHMNLQLTLSDTTHYTWTFSSPYLILLITTWTFSSPYLIPLIIDEPSAHLIWYHSLPMNLQLTLSDTTHYPWTFSSPYLIPLITHEPSACLIWYYSSHW